MRHKLQFHQRHLIQDTTRHLVVGPHILMLNLAFLTSSNALLPQRSPFCWPSTSCYLGSLSIDVQ
jgi:hypothetical protein